MNTLIKLRSVLASVAVAGTLLAVGGAGCASRCASRTDACCAPGQPVKLSGNWSIQQQPCAIFQQGEMLLLINERGEIGSARLKGPDSLTILSGPGWNVGLTAKISAEHDHLDWANGTKWDRASSPQ